MLHDDSIGSEAMTPEEIEKFVTAYLEFVRTPLETERSDELWWTWDTFWNTSLHDPDLCWRLILAVLERDQTEEVQGHIAAGALEDLLGEHGEKMIARVEERWRQDAEFRKVLRGVWRNSMSDEVWQRVLTLNDQGEGAMSPRPESGLIFDPTSYEIRGEHLLIKSRGMWVEDRSVLHIYLYEEGSYRFYFVVERLSYQRAEMSVIDTGVCAIRYLGYEQKADPLPHLLSRQITGDARQKALRNIIEAMALMEIPNFGKPAEVRADASVQQG